MMKAIALITHSIQNLTKKLQIYGLILTSAISIKTTNLIRPENSLKFRVLYDKYMDHIFLQLEDTRQKQMMERLQIFQFYQ